MTINYERKKLQTNKSKTGHLLKKLHKEEKVSEKLLAPMPKRATSKKTLKILLVGSLILASVAFFGVRVVYFTTPQVYALSTPLENPKTAIVEWNPCGLLSVICPDEQISQGYASYYDYVLPSGWSSVGHRICASREYEKGIMLKVTNLDNGKSVDCLVTDYGPELCPEENPECYLKDRIIDLSSTAFSKIGSLSRGVLKNIKVELIN